MGRRSIHLSDPEVRRARRSKCRYCGAEMLWTKTDSGRHMPLDVKTATRTLGGGQDFEAHFAYCKGATKARSDARARRTGARRP